MVVRDGRDINFNQLFQYNLLRLLSLNPIFSALFQEDCNNYIRVLLTHEQQIFACGTNAFSPQCTWRPVCIVGV